MSEWTVEPLESVAEIRASNVDKKSNPGEQSIRLCNYMDVYSQEYITEDIEFMEATATPAEIQRFGIELGDVLITKDSETPDDIGIPAVVVADIDNLVCGYHVALIKPNRDEVDPIYLAKQLASIETARHFGRLANGSTRYGLSYKAIANTPIRLAPFPQQQRIAEILSTIDETIEQTEALIAKMHQIKAGLMHDLFTRGVTKDGRLRSPREEAPQLYKQSPLGWIPREWELKLLGTMSVIVSGMTLNGQSSSGGVEVPYLRVANVQDGYLDLKEVKTIRVGAAQISKLALRSGDVLMNEGGDFDKLGRGTVWSEEIVPCIHQNHVFRVRPRTDVLRPRFLAYWSQSEFGKNYFVLSSKQSTNLASINSTQIHQFPVAKLDASEQEAIESRLIASDLQIDALRADLKKYRQLRTGLMHDLLTGHVRVEVKQSEETTS